MRKRRVASVDGLWKPRFPLAMRWALSTATALAYLHGLAHPIIHRDLKPLNMFLTKHLEADKRRGGKSCHVWLIPRIPRQNQSFGSLEGSGDGANDLAIPNACPQGMPFLPFRLHFKTPVGCSEMRKA